MTTLWSEPTRGLSNLDLASLTDEMLLRLQTSTMALPAYVRTVEDSKLLDRIGQHWRARKGPGLRLVRTCDCNPG